MVSPGKFEIVTLVLKHRLQQNNLKFTLSQGDKSTVISCTRDHVMLDDQLNRIPADEVKKGSLMRVLTHGDKFELTKVESITRE